jgi:hypothetical protein
VQRVGEEGDEEGYLGVELKLPLSFRELRIVLERFGSGGNEGQDDVFDFARILQLTLEGLLSPLLSPEQRRGTSKSSIRVSAKSAHNLNMRPL